MLSILCKTNQIFWAIAALLLLCGVTFQTNAESIDKMDNANGFYDETGEIQVIAAEGSITIRKTADGDAFTRWSLSGNKANSIPLDAAHDVLEIDFSAFPAHGKVDVHIGILDASNKYHAPRWLKAHKTTGRVTLASVSAFANEKGINDPSSYHLFLRVVTGPPGAFSIDRIRVSDQAQANDVNATQTAGKPPANDVVSQTDHHANAINDPNTLLIIFGEQPVEKGMRFERRGTEFKPIRVDGTTTPAWAATQSMMAKMPWMRSFRIKVEDPVFQSGGRPAVDLEIEYLLDTWGGVIVYADTENGSEKVGFGWGGSKKWQTLRTTLDHAHFSARNHNSSGKELSSDGYDLRIFAPNAPLYIRSIKLKGYPMTGDVDWERLLKVERVTTDTPAGIFAFQRREANPVEFDLRNIAEDDAALRYQIQVHQHQGPVVFENGGKVLVSGNTTEVLRFNFDTTSWPYGPYTATLNAWLDESQSQDPLLSEVIRMGVYSDPKLAKAAPGEFLFGLDAGSSATSATPGVVRHDGC